MENIELARSLKQPEQTFKGFWGVIFSHSTVPNRVMVKINGSAIAIGPCLYASTYNPTDGDTVYGRMTMGKLGPDYLVEGKTA